MGTKLTLTLDSSVIENAKKYAKSEKISLSKLIEMHLRTVVQDIKNKKFKIPPITRSLSSIAKNKTGKSDRELLTEALLKKHL